MNVSMSSQKGLSPAFIKLILFFVSIGWICYYIITGNKGAQVQEEEFTIEFENVKFSYKAEKRKVECQNKTVLIAISSAPDAFNIRMAFRTEWAKNANPTVIYRFFVGYAANETIKEANLEESKTYDDIVVLSIFDSYVTSVYKTYSMLNWQQNYCPTVKYILRTQDTVLISVPRLLYWIENEFDKEYQASDGKVIFCRTKEYMDTTVKYRIKSNNHSGFEYCEDHAYLVSSKATKLMLAETFKQKMIDSVEDLMFTGLLAEAIGTQRIHFPKHFTSTLTNCGCDKNQIPYVITSRGHWNDNDKLLSDRASSMQSFANMSCENSNKLNVEFFKACVAHAG